MKIHKQRSQSAGGCGRTMDMSDSARFGSARPPLASRAKSARAMWGK